MLRPELHDFFDLVVVKVVGGRCDVRELKGHPSVQSGAGLTGQVICFYEPEMIDLVPVGGATPSVSDVSSASVSSIALSSSGSSSETPPSGRKM